MFQVHIWLKKKFLTYLKKFVKKPDELFSATEKMSEKELDDKAEKLSEEDQKLLDQALANLKGFIEEETFIGYWEEEESSEDQPDINLQPSSD
jgi:hypothetical protein